MAGVNQWICIIFVVTTASVFVYGTLHLNKKYGEHELMKAQAKHNYPRYVINRSFPKLWITYFYFFAEQIVMERLPER
jgi:hypothetical protein